MERFEHSNSPSWFTRAASFGFALLIAFAFAMPLAAQAPTKDKNGTKTEPAKKKDRQSEIFKVWMKGKNADKKAGTGSKAGNKPAAGQKGDSKIKLKNPGPRKSGAPNSGTGGAPGTTSGDSRLLGSDDRPSFVMSILQFLGVMAVMLGGFYYGVRFLKSRSATLGGTGDLVRVIASVPLMQGKFLQIVDMAGKLLVLGVSEHGVNLIAEVDDARTADQIRIWDSKKSAGPMPAGMMDQLTRVLKTTEYRFWGKREKNQPAAPDFQALLQAGGGVVPQMQPEPAPATGETNQNMLFADVPPEPAPNRDQAGLQKLLSAQKKKLAAMKDRNQAE